MTEIPESISTLVALYIKGEASPSQQKQLEEWASLSVENTIWLRRFNDPKWILSQIDIFKEAKTEESRIEMWRRIKEEKPKRAITIKLPKMRQMRQLRLGKYGVIGLVTAAAAIILFYCLSFKTEQTQPTPATRIVQVNAPDTKVKAPITEANQVLLQKPVRKPAPKVTGKKIIKKALLIKPFADNYLQSINDSSAELKNEQFAGNNGVVYSVYGPNITMHHLKVPFGGCLPESLPDGSTCLVSDSSVFSYPERFRDNIRRIEITGRAWFNIRENSTCPFLVVSNNIQVETTGGEFNINAYKEETESRITAITARLKVAAGPNEVYLNPGETALITHGMPIKVQNENPDKVLAWKNGIFFFENDSLPVIARELGRWYNLSLQVTGHPKTIISSFTCSRNLQPSEVIEKLTTFNKDIHMRLENKKLIIDE